MTGARSKLNATERGLPRNFLEIDLASTVETITKRIREALAHDLRKRGLVVAVSGGIDSAACAALATRAVGPDKVLALLLPERDSSTTTQSLGQTVVSHLGVPHIRQDIAPILEALGCYRWRDDAIRTLVPEYRETWKSKIVLTRQSGAGYHFFNLIVQDDQGHQIERRLPHSQYLQIVAAMNFKQRVRKLIEYFHADRMNYAVVGTPNRLEYDQGFFVKNGDGAADIKPIAHLYKTQVYALARHMGLPPEVCQSVPTTDTYSLPQGQDEFYFGLPYEQMDAALWARDHGLSALDLASHLGVSEAHAQQIFREIESKRQVARYLHAHPVLIEGVSSSPVTHAR